MIKQGGFFSRILSEKARLWFVIGIMAAVPLGEFITNLFDVTFVTQPIIIAAFGIYGLILIIANIYEIMDNKKLYPTDMFCYLILFFALLSLVFSTDIVLSTTSFNTGEWIFHYCAYLALLMAASGLSNVNRKKTMLVFMAVAIFNSVVGALQTFGIFITDCNRDPEWYRENRIIFAFTQNSNFYAGLSILFTALFFGAFIFSEKKLYKILTLAGAMLSFYASIFTATRIAWVGNIMMVLFYAGSFIVMYKSKNDKSFLAPKLKRFIFITAVFAVLIIIWALFTDIFKQSLDEFQIDFGSSFDYFGSRRGYIWKFALESVPKHWLFGIGYDNFIAVFYTNPRWQDGMESFSHAHNEYIHILATQGVFAVINYISMLIYCVVTAVKNILKDGEGENRTLTWIFLGMLVSYAAQAFFNSSIINVAIYFWITIGLTMPKSSQKPIILDRNKTVSEK